MLQVLLYYLSLTEHFCIAHVRISIVLCKEFAAHLNDKQFILVTVMANVLLL